MLLADLLTWWYGRGWLQVARNGQRRLRHVIDLFSVSLLLRTLIAPWRKIITYPGAGLDAKMRAISDNFFSRMVGFVVRICVLLSAFVSGIVLGVYTLVVLLAWPLIPVALLASPILGLLL
ncbi:MAG: hypothetical protein JWM37_246 [Candidatus Saccharibacteria bacterium]|nr:hypothetical protein [Candidatus Saccharibacteria bacterium]